MRSETTDNKTFGEVLTEEMGARPIFWSITFLLTVALWMLMFQPDTLAVFVVAFFVAIGLSIFTFPFIGIALTLVLVPVTTLWNAACGKTDQDQDDEVAGQADEPIEKLSVRRKKSKVQKSGKSS